MAITSPGEICKECFFVSCPIGASISLTFSIISGIKSQCSSDQVCSYKCTSCTPDQWRTEDTIKRGGPSSLNKKFSNGTSIMDIDDRYFDDPITNDEADKLPLKGRRVVDEREAPSSRSLIPSMVPNLVPTESLVVEAVGGGSSPLLTPKVIDDSSSTPPFIKLGDGSTSLSVMEVRDDSPSFPPETSTSLPVDVHRQDKRKVVVIGGEERVALKRVLEEKGASVESGGVKKIQTDLL
ncbi:hypothetical protein Adt_35275 [Abeliophyllum distichum]|uniref:Uncharacterized protein n=1 Tax=Abeliophyllum distichum TaxID=126358 RepID=A0ABD1QF66_9LAMI